VTDTDWPDFDDVIDPADVPVPGTRPRVKHEKREPVEQPVEKWDAFPKVYRVDGKDTELFGARALCLAVGLNNEQLKHWERRGWLPKTNVRMPRKVAWGARDTSPLTGGVIPGRRLYTRAFIEGMVRLVNATPPGSEFAEQALDLYHDTMPGEPAP